ncbi:hypothetical protein F53441_5834 [Fusarium austroafricanum]|uniref:Uncharacterized protein n=1 Tax=Fusarium austroafricanum TaxID=2364996 RepID=A0A8H4KH11_9HYPO|nr:hypothetical protein F53441_5834 [Fusarium austroafricanum]
MSLLVRFALAGLWQVASVACAQNTVTVTETVTECASDCYSVVSQCTFTEYLCTSTGNQLPTGSSAIVSESATFTNVIPTVSIPSVSIPSTTKFANTTVYTFTPKTTAVVSESDVSAGSSALAGETSELESTSSTLLGYSTTLTQGVMTSASVTNLETIPTFVPSVDSSALASGTTLFPQGGGSTTISEDSTESVSESSPFSTESAVSEGLSTETYASQQGSSTISEGTGVSTTTLKSVLTSQVTLTESISTVYSLSTAKPVTSEDNTEAIGTSSQIGGASSETEQGPVSTEDVTSEATSLTPLTSRITLTQTETLPASESTIAPGDTTGASIVESSNTYSTAASETYIESASTIKTPSSETSVVQTNSTASGSSPESTAAGVSTLTPEVEASTSTSCAPTKHTHIYYNTTIVHSTAEQSIDSSALAGSFTSASALGSGYTSATSAVVEQTTIPGTETSEGQAGISTSGYLESTGETAIGVQTTLPSDTLESTPVESTAVQTDADTTTTSQSIQTPISSSTPEESTGPQGYDFSNPSSVDDGWPTASFASTADAATGFSSFTTLLTTSKVTDTASTTTGHKEPEYQPPAYEPPSYHESAYVRKRWGF